MIGRKLGGVVGVFLLVAGPLTCRAVPACAHDEDTWPVKHKLVGSDGGKSEDVSGIACDTLRGFPRSCLLIDDNLQSAQLVTLEDGRIIAGDTVKLIDDQFKRTPLELDGEGVAFAGGFYYVVGSHGHPRDKKHKLDAANDKEEIDARITAASQVVRVKPGPNGTAVADERSPNLRRMITDQPELAPFAGRRLENNGVTIEGIAIRRGQVFVGFRGPVLEDGHAPILSVALDSLFGSGAPNKHLYRLRLGDGQGVRDLAPLGEGFLILAGPAADGPGRYAVHWWDGDSEKVRFLRDLSDVVGDDRERKPEALLFLDQGPSGLRVLILSDGKKEGAPVAVTMPAP
jgi:hypothetical protein